MTYRNAVYSGTQTIITVGKQDNLLALNSSAMLLITLPMKLLVHAFTCCTSYNIEINYEVYKYTNTAIKDVNRILVRMTQLVNYSQRKNLTLYVLQEKRHYIPSANVSEDL